MLSRVAVVLALGLASSASLLSPLSSSARQLQIDLDDLPAACRSVCEDPINVLNTYGSDYDLLCKQDILHGYAECMSCLIEENGAVSVSQAQAATDGLVDACNSLGYNVSDETVSGSSGGSTNDDTGDDSEDDSEDSQDDGDDGDGALATVQSAGLASLATFAGAAFVFFA